MKRCIIVLALFVSSFAEGIAAETAYALEVKGMVCAFCAYRLSKELKAAEGVVPESIDVDLERGRIALRSERPIEAATLAELVEAAGFKLAAVTETASASTGPRAPTADVPIVSLSLDARGLARGDFDGVLEALGALAAARAARLTVAGPADAEMPAVRPMLMGRKPAMDVEFAAATDDGPVRVSLYAD